MCKILRTIDCSRDDWTTLSSCDEVKGDVIFIAGMKVRVVHSFLMSEHTSTFGAKYYKHKLLSVDELLHKPKSRRV